MMGSYLCGFVQNVNERWNSLAAPSDKLYTSDPKSTYIKSPPFFDGLVSTSHQRSSVDLFKCYVLP